VFDTYTLVQGVDQFLPVHCYIPGCPPRPESLLDALMKIQDIIGEEDSDDKADEGKQNPEIETEEETEESVSAEQGVAEPVAPDPE
ncbi:MAG: hypothetical protein MK138_16505, partial [Planctomycetes bacterium]|nr:hypothetical protein [Planctomycetota bacterium]